MMQKNTAPIKENKMGTMPTNKLLLNMSLPMMIAMLIQALYNIVDSMFVAQISENALSAVSLAFPMQNFMIAIATGTGVGVNSLLSKNLGAQRFNISNKTANVSMFLTLMNWFVFILVGLFVSAPFLRGQTDVSEIISYGQTYLHICCIASLGIYAEIALERLLQATGRTIYTLITQATGAILNIILDPILIFGMFGMPKMGVAGAATATVIGQFVAAGLALYFNLRKNHEIQFSFKNMLPTKFILANIYKVAVPSILMVSIGSVMMFCLNRILATFTTTAIAVFGGYFKLQSFIFMPIFGLNNGMVPIVAYNYGARNRKRISSTIFYAATFASSIMLVGLLVFQFLPHKLLLLFNASEEMLSIGVPALRIISLSFILAGFNIVGSSVFQALGNGVYSLLMSVIRQLVVLLPVAYLMSKTGILNLIWLAFPIAEIVAAILCGFYLHKIMKRLDF